MKNYQAAEEIKLVFSGADYFDVLEKIIDNSQEVLHLQTYIFANDNTGLRVIEALRRASERKVKVFMLIDAYGSFPFSNANKKLLEQSGVHFRLYATLFSTESMYLARRLHHKIIVADKKTALVGGLNIADKYSGNQDVYPWLDYAVYSRGEVCEYLHFLCEAFYRKKKFQPPRPAEQLISKNQPAAKLIRFRRNDWIKGQNEIHTSYNAAIISAKSSITLVASYFLPGNRFRKLLQNAAHKGVEIKIILTGKSDIPSMGLAEHFLYDFYLKNNIKIYEWNDSVMHGKAMIVDQKWATVGSYNLNFLSHYISVELNTDIVDAVFAKSLSDHLQRITINNCSEITHTFPAKRNMLLERFKRWLAYNFYRLLMHFIMPARKYNP
jgi:cardiolipin synthase A/B